MRIRIAYIVSNINKAVAFEWIASGLDRNKFEISFILLGPEQSFLHEWLIKNGFRSVIIPMKSKLQMITSFFKVLFYLFEIKPEVVHTHLFEANLVGLISAKILGINKRIYTRHHSTFHHEYFPKAVKWDKFVNRLATHIVAISENVANVLVEYEKVNPEKVRLIHHGFDLENFRHVTPDRIERLRQKYSISYNSQPVIGVISRYIVLKGVQFVIPAFKELLNKYPNALLVLANANGPDERFLKDLLSRNIPPKNFIQISFEDDLFALYKLFDVYVHVPINHKIEAFGQTYVEALAAGVPSVFTLSGVAKEFIKNEYNALVVDYKDSKQIAKAVDRLLQENELRANLIKNGLNSVSGFSLAHFIQKLTLLYE